MLGTGMGLLLSEILKTLRNVRFVTMSLVASFVVIPLLALGLTKVLNLNESMSIGLLLMGCAGGSPFLPKIVQVAKANMALAVGLLVLLMVVTVGYMPIVLPFLLPGVSVDSVAIAKGLVLQMLLPLGAGLALNGNRPDLAAKAKPVFDGISSVAIVVVVGLLIVTNFSGILAVFGTGGILASALFIVIAFAVGWVLGGPTRETRTVLGLGTAPRNVAAVFVVAATFDDPTVVIMPIVITILALLILMPVAGALAKKAVAVLPR
jgi:BASS family bile acid:Na+ symporter